MNVKWIWIKRNNKTKRETIKEAYLESGTGILGDIKAKGGDRQITIISSINREYIEENHGKSICMNKFHENITIEGLKANDLNVGDKLEIADTIQEITSLGKICFEGCSILESREKCPLSSGVVFTKVVKSGNIKTRDKVRIIKNQY